jgi:hypothetical protein
MERLVWTEYEPDDASEVFREVFDSLGEIARTADFLDIPVETLVRDLSRVFQVGEFTPPPEPVKPPKAPKIRPAPRTPDHDAAAEIFEFDACPPEPAGT